MGKIRWLLVILLMSMTLNACSPQAKIQDKCLVGNWMVTSDEILARAMLPPGAFTMDDLHFAGVGGGIAYRFSQTGVIAFQAVSWQVKFDVQVEQDIMEMIMSADGTAIAELSVTGDQITVGKVSQDITAFSAYLDGEEMLTALDVNEFAPLFLPNAQTGHYQCEGDSLSITYADQAGVAYTLDFLRIEEKTK